jgi:hypothetical protein
MMMAHGDLLVGLPFSITPAETALRRIHSNIEKHLDSWIVGGTDAQICPGAVWPGM